MDRLMALKRGGEDDPDFGRALGGREGARPAPPSAAAGRRRGGPGRPARARRWRPTTRCSSPRSSGRGSSGASPSTTSPPTSTRPPCSATSGATGPTSPAGDRRRVQGPHPGRAARAAGRGPGGRRAAAGRGLRLLRRQRRGRRPDRLEGRHPHGRVAALHLPPPARRPVAVASPTSSGPSTPARPTTPPSTW